ncbi:hypothetical protein [Sporosarcina ureilytica]|uniref:Uncharacterized protein n=1 Tax=Sporosarcina ureilytica TaxID=298596 RepID=A0A1D8JEL6_9BACL|nr:hypothetical protein [Sporosarcina ureilytica]AOV07139.1 hypothetical protein BI350_06015 [Sporosarcina ureilytica]
MIVILVSVFSAIIIMMTAYSLIKALIIAYKRCEITYRNLILYSKLSFAICGTIAFLTPFILVF